MEFPLLQLGLTGNPGSGKSTALAGFAQCGWQTLDADELCAEVYVRNLGGICEKLRQRWGQEFLGPDGLPVRRLVAETIFAHPEERLWLEGQVHPQVRKLAASLAGATAQPTVFAVPLLFEAGWQEDFTAVATVWAKDELRRRRLRRRGWDDEEIRRRDAAQWSAELKLAKADHGLINNGRREDLWRQCRALTAPYPPCESPLSPPTNFNH